MADSSMVAEMFRETSYFIQWDEFRLYQADSIPFWSMTVHQRLGDRHLSLLQNSHICKDRRKMKLFATLVTIQC